MKRSDEYVKVRKRADRFVRSHRCTTESTQGKERQRNHNELPVIMERKRCEPRLRHLHVGNAQEYHAVEDQEETSSVLIRSALPIAFNEDYADRSTPPKSSSPVMNRSPDTPPRVPRRNFPGPAVHRELKPGREQRAQQAREQAFAYTARTDDKRRADHHAESLLASQRHLIPTPRSLESPPWESPCPTSLRPGDRSHATTPDPRGGLFKDKCARSGAPPHMPRYSRDLEFRGHLDLSFSPQRNNYFEDPVARRRNRQAFVNLQAQDDINVHKHIPKARPAQVHHMNNWYIGTCERTKAEEALYLNNEDGAFLVRDHSKTTEEEPFVLAVLQDKKVYNIKIRFLKSNQKFALGTGLRTNDTTLDMCIEYLGDQESDV